MKNTLTLLIFILLSCLQAYPSSTCEICNSIDTNFNQDMKNEIIYNVLNLDDLCRKKIENSIKEDIQLINHEVSNLKAECKCLQILIMSGDNSRTLHNQKQVIGEIYNKILKLERSKYKKIKSVLSGQESSKLNRIIKLDKHNKNCKFPLNDYYKSNPQLTRFGIN